MQVLRRTQAIPQWLDSETRALVEDIIDTLAEHNPEVFAIILYGSIARHDELPLDDPDTSDVDLLALLDTDTPYTHLHKNSTFFHNIGEAEMRHRDAPREVQVMFSSRTMREWDPTFIVNVAHDGILLFARSPLPTALTSPPVI